MIIIIIIIIIVVVKCSKYNIIFRWRARNKFSCICLKKKKKKLHTNEIKKNKTHAFDNYLEVKAPLYVHYHNLIRRNRSIHNRRHDRKRVDLSEYTVSRIYQFCVCTYCVQAYACDNDSDT